jgi:hypothetical protein
MSKKQYKQFEKSGYTFPKGLTAYEKQIYLRTWSTGKLPKLMKVKIDGEYESRSAFARVLGYGRVSFIARKTKRSPFYAVMKLTE